MGTKQKKNNDSTNEWAKAEEDHQSLFPYLHALMGGSKIYLCWCVKKQSMKVIRIGMYTTPSRLLMAVPSIKPN